VQDILGFEDEADITARQSSPRMMRWWWWLKYSEPATILHALSAGKCGKQVPIEHAATIWQQDVIWTALKQTAVHAGLTRS